MKNENKIKVQTKELKELRQRFTELEKSEIEHKRTEEELRKYRDHLEELVEKRTVKLRRTNEQLQREIAERKKVEAVLRESELRYRILAEAAQDFIYLIGPDMRIKYVNNAGAQKFQSSPEDIIGKQINEVFPPEAYEHQQHNVKKVFETGEQVYVEGKCPFPNGDLWLSSRLVPVENKAGGISAVLGISRDITKRKRAEEQLMRQNAVLDAINKVFRETLTCETEEEVAHTCLAVAEELTGSKFGFIGEVNQAGRFDTIAISDPGWDACRMPKSNAVVMIKDMEIRGIWVRVLKDEQSLIVNDPASHSDRVGTPEGHPLITSFMGVLLKHADRTIGMIALANKESGYDLADKETIETLSVAFVEALNRKRAEREVWESKERFRALTESTSDWIWEVDVNGVYTYASPKVKELLGYEPEEIIGKTPFDTMTYEEAKRVAMEFGTIVESRRPFAGLENTNQCKDGRLVVLETSGVPIFDAAGNFQGYRGIDRDITERKQLEEELRKSEEKYRLIFENAEEGISVYEEFPDGSRKFVECNPQYAEVSGYSREELMQINDTRKIQLGHNTPQQEAVNIDKLLMGQPYRGLFSWIRPDGKENYIEYTAARLNIEGSTFTVGIDHDITDRKRAEEHLQASLKEKEVLLKEIHHRVKNNLQIICSLLDLQADSVEDEQTLEIFKESKNRIRTMALVHEYLYQSKDLARIDFAEYIPDLANYSFRSYQSYTDTIQLRINIEDGISLDIDKAIPCGLILNELVSNSLKYAFPAGAQSHPENRGREGEIRIDLRSDKDNECTFIVSDNGVGFPKDLDFRNTESLGLQLVVSLVDQLDGTIELDRSGGTTFKITFP